MPPISTEWPCPRCRHELVEGRTRQTRVRTCSTCGGVFLESDAAQRVLRALDPDLLEFVHRVTGTGAAAGGTPAPTPSTAPTVGAATAPARPPELRAPAACPVCRAPMLLRRPAGAGVTVDLCAGHGTWFDRGELPAVIVALERRRTAGGAPVTPTGSPTRRHSEEELKGEGGMMVLDALVRADSTLEAGYATLDLVGMIFSLLA
ncbi:MAG: zf-TFIIB domain-containing protein [Planctomycetes bacterium]|nr:zf-TFIIB domain-containing protein [Planctomycetota bacterium]